MTENDRKILARACEPEEYNTLCIASLIGCRSKPLRKFDSPDDWNLVRVKVVQKYFTECINYLRVRASLADPPEVLCETTLNWVKTRPDLFQWVVDMEKGEGSDS